MSSMTSYSYAVLRYVHDITTGEFINVGVAIHAPEAKFTQIRCRHTYGRLSRFFPGIKHEYFRTLMKHVEYKFHNISEKLYSEFPWKNYNSVMNIANEVLPEDDSSMQWSFHGVGQSKNLDITIDKLFERMVLKYEEKTTNERKTDDDVWKGFKRTLENRHLLQLFAPKKIRSQDDEVEFSYTWKNGILHCIEPLSFDLSSPDSIRDKAHKWLGRISSVSSSSEQFKVYFLVAQPQDDSLMGAYDSALKILNKAPVDKHIISEESVETLSSLITQAVEDHESSHF